MQVDQRPDVALAPSPLGVHKLFGLLVSELHVVAAASPLPLDSVPRGGGRRRPRRRSVPGRLAATLQEVAHTAGLGHGVGDAGRRDGVNERRLPDIYGREKGFSSWIGSQVWFEYKSPKCSSRELFQ